jgi:hypothetical protein
LKRIPSRAENRALKAHLESHDIPSPLSPLLSAFINRREIDRETEAHLKAACTAIVKGYVDEPETRLNFKPLHQTRSVPHLTSQNEKRTSRPQISTHVDSQAPPVPVLTKTKRAVASSKSVQDFRPADHTHWQNTSQGMQSSLQPELRCLTAQADLRKLTAFSPVSPYRPKTAVIEESDGSYATPRTGSTDRYPDTMSTAFTSTAITPSKPLQRLSNQLLLEQASQQKTIKENDEQAEKWMKLELACQSAQLTGDRQTNRPESQSSIREWSLQSRTQEAFRPNTAIGAKPVRQDSLERPGTKVMRSSSSHGHVFSLHQKFGDGNLGIMSNQDSTRPSTEGTHFEAARHSSNVDLNRALPPLPGLDTWNRYNDAATVQSEPTSTTLTGPKMHVVNLMKSSGLQSAPISSPLKTQQASDQQETFTKNKSAETASNISRHISTAHSKSSSISDACFSPLNRSRAPSGTLSRETIHEHGPPPVVKSPAASHHTRLSDAPTTMSTGTRPSLSHGEGSIPNFSRKISIDIHGTISSQMFTEVTALPPMPPPSKPRGLRRVFSRFELFQGSKKIEKAVMTWMDHFEAEGVKTGVMLPRGSGPAAPPIVRY